MDRFQTQNGREESGSGGKRILLTGVVLALVVFAFTPFADRAGAKNLDGALARGFATIVVVKGLNGIISVIQDLDLTITPMGVGVQVGAGEILDPINDLLEDFSTVLMYAVASLGMQKVLLAVGGAWGVKLLLLASALLLLLGLWWPRVGWALTHPLLGRLALAMLLVRFAVPVSAVASEAVYAAFLDTSYRESLSSVEEMRTDLKDVELPGVGGEGEEITTPSTWGTAKALLVVKNAVLSLRDKVGVYTRYVVNLIIVFMLQTVVFPLLFIWGLYKGGQWLLGGAPPYMWRRVRLQ